MIYLLIYAIVEPHLQKGVSQIGCGQFKILSHHSLLVRKMSSNSSLTLPHGNATWPLVKNKLQKVADKTLLGLNGLASVISISPHWGLDKPPLLSVLAKVLSRGDHFTTEQFSDAILPYIAGKALQVETLFENTDIQLLMSGLTGGVLLSRHQTSCLLALAFFHLLPPAGKHGSRFQHLSLLGIFEHGFFQSQQSKCLCILSYFDRLRHAENEDNKDFMKRCISIERSVLEREICKREFWSSSVIPLGGFETHKEGCIEESEGSLQVDFANEFIGGGVLQQGNVQEEIRFVINPECLVSLLYCESMAKSETILITGAERFSSYSGYGGGFTYTGPYVDPNPVDIQKNRTSVSIVAMDAIPAAWLPGGAFYQFKEDAILRETCKAYCGFNGFAVIGDTAGGKDRVPVATGNWGCGAFGGNKKLKTLVQWLAASQAGRKVIYYTFGDQRLSEAQNKLIKCLLDAKVTVGQLYSILIDKDFIEKITDKEDIFEYVMNKVQQ